MLKNFPDTNFFIKHNSAINLNNYLPYRNNNNNSKKNYKFNELNPIHSERNMNTQRTRNYKTPNREYKSKMVNSSMNLKAFNIPNSLRIPKKTESFFIQNNSNINSNINSNSLLNSVRYISSPLLNQQDYIKNSCISNINNNNNKNNFKKTLILDLDETLVHSAFYPFRTKSDIILNINLDGKNHIIHVLKRPNLDYFLKKVSEIYNIIIFTASLSQYASPLIDILDPKNKFKRLFRENCLKRNGFYIKDLNQIGKNFKDIIIIDNNPISFIMNQDNGLPIMTWYENMNDNELIKLIPLLEYLSNVNDVRPIINQIVNRESNEIDFKIVDNLLLKYDRKIEDDKNYMINGAYNNLDKKEKENNYYKQNILINKEKIDINNINAKNNSFNEKYSYNGNDKIYNFPYNNKQIYYSLSNMSYDEIQNEGYIENNKANLENDYMNIFNGYRKNLIKNKNKMNLFMKTKEIFNFSNNNDNRLIQKENNKQISDDGNSFNKINNNNQFSKDKSENYLKYGINKNNNNYNFIYMSKKNNNLFNDYNNSENIFQTPKDLSSNFCQCDDYEIPKESITINYQEKNRIKQNSFDGINNISSQKIQENNLKDISSYRSNSVINKNKPKNFNLPSNNIYNQNQLYKKPINIKEKNNQGQNIYEAKKIINYDLKEEEENKDEKSIYKSKIEERKERLKEMKRKIEEINRDIKKTEQYYYQTQRKSNKQNKDNIYNNNVKTSRHTFNRMNINYQDENISNEDINPDSYKAQIIDTDINRNDNKENDDLNKRENIFNKKNKYSNINIYRNSKVKYMHENRSEVTHIDDKYIKKKENDFYFQTPNLKKGKFKNSIFKNYANNAINKSNGQINKTSNKNKSENTYIS